MMGNFIQESHDQPWGAGGFTKDHSCSQGGGEGVNGGSKTDHVIF